VVSAGLTEQDDLLAVGVVPVAVTRWFGDQPFEVWPWAQPRLGSATPALLNLDNGIQIDQIAALKPDLIVAINAGLDADTEVSLVGFPGNSVRDFLRQKASAESGASLSEVATDLLGSAVSGVISRGERSLSGTTALWLGEYRF
jgi:hypothetical protein